MEKKGIREELGRARQDIRTAYNEFTTQLDQIVPKAAASKDEMEESPLFATTIEPLYNSQRNQIRDIISQTPFAEEFIRRYEVNYGKGCITRHLED